MRLSFEHTDETNEAFHCSICYFFTGTLLAMQYLVVSNCSFNIILHCWSSKIERSWNDQAVEAVSKCLLVFILSRRKGTYP